MTAATASVIEYLSGTPGGAPADVDALLAVAREQLGMQVAFVSRFEGDERVIRNVSSSIELPAGPGFREPLAQSHCQRIVDGRVDPVTPDTLDSPAAMEVPATTVFGIRSFVGVPIHTADGALYGTLCAMSTAPDPTLQPRDAGVLRVLAWAVAALVENEDRAQEDERRLVERLERLDAAGGPTTVYQPIVRLADLVPIGAEALSRFPANLGGTPTDWFRDAALLGRGSDLELQSTERALAALDTWGGYLSVNLSPETILDPRSDLVLSQVRLNRLVLEITEHEPVADYAALRTALAPWQAGGLRIAVDDCGAGYASMNHVLALMPDIIKLDIALVRDIHRDRARQALATALLAYADATGATVVAEGVETLAELSCLTSLGVPLGQGYLLGSPSEHLPRRRPVLQRGVLGRAPLPRSA